MKLILTILLLYCGNLSAQIDTLPKMKPDSITKVVVDIDSSIVVITKEFYSVSPKDTHIIMQKLRGYIREDSTETK